MEAGCHAYAAPPELERTHDVKFRTGMTIECRWQSPGQYSDDWSKQDPVKRAREIGIRGRSTMTKAELIKALLDH
jgi:hypothetical protein